MTVHCVELMSSKDVESQKVKNKISDLKSKYGEKLPKQEAFFDSYEDRQLNDSVFRGSFRVDLTSGSKASEKNDLTEQIRKELDKSASWWQLRWHECDHDEDDKSGCSWDYSNSSGSVPSEVSY